MVLVIFSTNINKIIQKCIIIVYLFIHYCFQLCTMYHRGEIVEKAVRESGFSLTKLAQRMGKSRKWLYDAFENPNLSIEFVLEIGKIIHHDFGSTFSFSAPQIVSEEQVVKSQTHHDEIAFWKDKYIQVLEENKRLLERLAQLD